MKSRLKTNVTFVNHASVLIEGSGIGLLSDPWYQGDAFNNGWRLLQETPDDVVSGILSRVTHIWISHEHPDHFSIQFFKSFADRFAMITLPSSSKRRGTSVLFLFSVV